MIKCEIAKKAPMGPEVGASGGKSSQRPLPVHTGGVTVVLIEDGEIITAGADGHIRIWDLDVIDLADAPSELDSVYPVEPQLEHKVATPHFTSSNDSSSCCVCTPHMCMSLWVKPRSE